MHVPFIDLAESTKRVKAQYLKALDQFLDRGQFILTEEVQNFEKNWAKRVGTSYCAGVSSGADALFLALTAFGIGQGDEVITQGNAYNASVTAIMRCRAIPRFVDIDQETLTLDVKKMESLVTSKTKAVLPVHLYGQPNNMKAIMEFAKKHHLFVIEDCAQAHDAEYAGKKVGVWGHAGCFSFYPTKNLGAFGDAGAVVTDDEMIYQEIKMKRNLGQEQKNNHKFFGTNMRLDPIQAIALDLKLKFLSEETTKRIEDAAYYDELISKAKLPVRPIAKLKEAKHVYHLYIVEVPSYPRDKLMIELKSLGIESAVYYPSLVYEQAFYKGPVDNCPIAEKMARSILALPFFVGITKEQQEYVTQSLQKILK